VTAAFTPLNLTVLSAGVVLKLDPVIITLVLAVPDVGLIATGWFVARKVSFMAKK
jgi:hypothetical protein